MTPGRPATSSSPTNAQLFILGGQSNMEGRGAIIGEQLAKFPNLEFIYTLGGRWIRPAFEPTHSTELEFGGSQFPDLWPVRKKRGRGLGLAFADKWAELDASNHHIALVPSAKGGTSLKQHLPLTRLYEAGKERIRQAEVFGSVFAFLDSQGESDATNLEDASSWADRYREIVTARRSDHGAEIPVIFTQLGDNPSLSKFPCWDLVKQQQEIASSQIPRSRMVQTSGLEKVDGIHYTSDSCLLLGELMALSLHTLLKS